MQRGKVSIRPGAAIRAGIAPAAALALAGCIPPPRGPGAGRPPPAQPRQSPPPQSPPPEASPPIRQPVDLPDRSEPQPTWEAKRVAAEARTVPGGSYRVVSGDTLRAIAERTGAGSEAIARANRLDPPFTIRPGQRLKIPAGRYHRVREGETGIAIARAYRVEWDRIIDLNALAPPYLLRTGMLLMLPPESEVAAMSMEQRAAAFQIDIEDLATGAEPAIAENEAPPPPRTKAVALPPDKPVAEPTTFTGRFSWPLTGPVLTRFGPAGGGRVNQGIKIATTRGAPIHAAADGVVAYAGDEISVYGGLILIKHGQGWLTAYGHLETLLVARGQKVSRGEVIGYAGETGSARQPQLHFEIRRNRTPVDPVKELPRQ